MTPDLRIHAIDHARRLAEPPHAAELGYAPLTPQPAWVAVSRLPLRSASGTQVSEALQGEPLQVLDVQGGVAWVRTRHDRYLGWVNVAGITPDEPQDTLTVTALRGHIYTEPRVSSPIVQEVSLGAKVARRAGEVVEEHHRRWLPVAGGYLQEVCTSPLTDTDAAALACRFVSTPYVWGGRSAWGLDCSGLTQLCLAAFGVALPRDADQQQAALTPVSSPQRGDLAFFPGHVGLMLNERRMVHANATHMAVSVEELGAGEYGTRLAAELLGFGRP